MNYQVSKKPGEVAVNSLEVMSEFEKTSIQILRHANDLFQENEPADLPMSIKELFSNCQKLIVLLLQEVPQLLDLLKNSKVLHFLIIKNLMLKKNF